MYSYGIVLRSNDSSKSFSITLADNKHSKKLAGIVSVCYKLNIPHLYIPWLCTSTQYTNIVVCFTFSSTLTQSSLKILYNKIKRGIESHEVEKNHCILRVYIQKPGKGCFSVHRSVLIQTFK